jgi:hypothetical protein
MLDLAPAVFNCGEKLRRRPALEVVQKRAQVLGKAGCPALAALHGETRRLGRRLPPGILA